IVLQLGHLSNPEYALEIYKTQWQTFGHQVLGIPITEIAEVIDPLIIQVHTNPKIQFANLTVRLREDFINKRIIISPFTVKEQYSLLYNELVELIHRFERDEHQLIQIDFVVELGHLYIREIKPGKYTDDAALKIAVDMANSKLINKSDAIKRVSTATFNRVIY